VPTSTSVSAQSLTYASIFTTRTFRALAAENVHDIAARLAPLAEVAGARTTAEAFEGAHARLLQDYRCEYVYKNALVSKILFQRHRPWTASAILEQPMGDSEADIVVLNGTTTVYEIKTEFDQYSRLSKQLHDYSTRAAKVFVVTSDRRASALESRLPDGVGLLGLRRNGALTTLRDAVSAVDRLNIDHLFGLLRSDEAQTFLKETIGYQPDVPRGLLSARMRELFCALDIRVAHAGVVTALRGRGAQPHAW